MVYERQSWHEIESKLKEIVSDKLSVASEQVTLDANFIEDLGADSLDTVEIAMSIEDEFGIDIPDELAERSVTLAKGIAEFMKIIPRE